MIRTCTVIAVEGTQAAGKTTLVHALTAHLRERGIHVACTGEPAREAPFMEEIVLHGQGHFDLPAEIDLFGQQLTVPLRAARHHQLLIADKTPANVIALACLLLDTNVEPGAGSVLAAAESFCRAWMPLVYDTVIYCRDRYDQRAGGDRMRQNVHNLQDQADELIYKVCRDTGVHLLEMPTGLTNPERVRWAIQHVEQMGLAAT
ncbi:AAA family ATPase [Streptomyces sp. NPDC054796]